MHCTLPPALHHPLVYRTWAEIQSEARDASEAMGLPLDRALRLVLTMGRVSIDVIA